MPRWAASTIPPWQLLLGLIVVITGASVLVNVMVRRRFPSLREGAHNDDLKFMLGFVATVYSFFVGFLTSGLWAEADAVNSRLQEEGAALMQMAQDRNFFDTADSARIRQGLLDYVRAAEAEWPTAAVGRSAPETDTALANLYTAYGTVKARSNSQTTLLSTSYVNLNSASQARTHRILQARDQHTGYRRMALILLTSALVLGCGIIYGVPNPRWDHAVVVGIAVVVAVNLAVIMEGANPFVGEVAISPGPLQAVIEVLSPVP
jgi:hypothetical protein